MRIELKKKSSRIYAIEVKGRVLAPAIQIFDNRDEVKGILVDCFVLCENIIFDEKCGIVSWPSGCARIGDYIVCNDSRIEVYRSLVALHEKYEYVR